MRVLVTRPEADAAPLKAHLVALGHDVFVEPLIEVRFDGCDEIELEGAQCLLATSRNAVRALAQSSGYDQARELQLYVVGPGTAAIAKAVGFQQIVEGPGTASELLDVLAERAEVNAGPIVCLTGDQRAFDMPSELQRLGFQVTSPLVYRMQPATAFSPRLIEYLAGHAIDAVLLFSPRTARTYARLLKSHKLLEVATELCHICLSQNVVEQLASLSLRKVLVAERPNLRQVIALLDQEGSRSGP